MILGKDFEVTLGLSIFSHHLCVHLTFYFESYYWYETSLCNFHAILGCEHDLLCKLCGIVLISWMKWIMASVWLFVLVLQDILASLKSILAFLIFIARVLKEQVTFRIICFLMVEFLIAPLTWVKLDYPFSSTFYFLKFSCQTQGLWMLLHNINKNVAHQRI